MSSSSVACLVLEDGSVFKGRAIGAQGTTAGEVVFNTAMTGYQEILTDPSYLQQIVTLTYPHIGNTGINLEDMESDRVQVAGLVIRDLPRCTSNWRAVYSLADYLKAQGVIAIADIDTRHLTSIIREKGALKGCIQAGVVDEAKALKAAKNFPGLSGAALAGFVSTKTKYLYASGTRYKVVVVDFGVKLGILRQLEQHGCEIWVMPVDSSAEEILALAPDGVLLSNGPGDPAPLTGAIVMIKTLIAAKVPLFGICLGIQLLALALGAKTFKMKFGHHGANHPVQTLDTGSVMITSQNHGFAVDSESLPPDVMVTHRSLFDESLQGFRHRQLPIFGFQGHPEASPGPLEGHALFQVFVDMMQQYRMSEAILNYA